jgi:hypothetical protein
VLLSVDCRLPYLVVVFPEILVTDNFEFLRALWYKIYVYRFLKKFGPGFEKRSSFKSGTKASYTWFWPQW